MTISSIIGRIELEQESAEDREHLALIADYESDDDFFLPAQPHSAPLSLAGIV